MAENKKNDVASEKETASPIKLDPVVAKTPVEVSDTPVPAKRGRKPGTKNKPKAPAKKATAKKTAVKALTLNAVVKAAAKKMKTADLSKIARSIAVNVELYGECSGNFYILIQGDKIAVEPYKYDDGDVWIKADAKSIVAVFSGEAKIYDELSNGSINIYDNVKKAILFVDAIR